MRDRNPLFIQLSDGGIRNRYTVKILNKLYEPRTFALSTAGLANAQLELVGFEGQLTPEITVPASDLRELRVHVTVPKDALSALEGAETRFRFEINDLQSEARSSATTTFRRPE